jgi:hypothetical protein
MSWLARARPRDVVVAAQPDEVLLHGVAVLRRLGARITRYDADEGTAEARLRRLTRPALIRLRAEAAGTATTRLRVESDALAWAPMFRRFRVDLLTLERPVS